ncbi:MAG: tetratricopeptide repeat protein [Acidobacteria bacterium]|nr:tetratricopeptide repeat protein [Acidobacteriota bacterium]
MIGQTFSHYRIVENLGRGGMGDVYLAEDTSLQRMVAIKFLSPDKQQDHTAQYRILREARSAAGLDHANICTIHEVGSTEGRDFIVMEYVDGRTLRDRIAEGPMGLEEALRLIGHVVEALEEAHGNGIIHKDLKPANIMITRKGFAKVMDFGLAMKLPGSDSIESGADTLTTTVWGRDSGGTPAYMSPEQLLGESIDVQSDIFSLGIVFYELLSGQHPFRAANPVATVDRILHEEHEPILKFNPGIPDEVGKLIDRMLAKDPKERPGSARELLADLRDAARLEKTSRPAAFRIPGIPGRKRGVMYAAIIILLLLAGAVPIVYKWTRQDLVAELPSKKYLAILPFQIIGASGDYANFSRGLISNMNARLTKLTVHHPLVVVSPSEIIENNIHTVRQASREFGVNLVMEGSLYQVEEQLRINYLIVDAKTKNGIRGDTITASMSSPFELMDSVIASVLNNLDIELLPEEKSSMAIRTTQKPEAYSYYVTALGYLQEYQKTENVGSAIEILQNALEQDPKFAEAYAALGEAYWRQYKHEKEAKRVEEALAACNRAVELDGNLASGHTCLGVVFTGTGRYEQAIQEYKHALDLEPTSDAAYRGLGSAYVSLGLFVEAEDIYSRAIKLKPEYWAGYSRLGSLYAKLGRYDEAAVQFSEVTQLVPDHHFGYSNLGGIYLYEGRYTDAIQMLRRSVSLRRTEEAFSNLGTAYFYLRRFGEAAAAYEKAIELNERDWIVWGNLGDARYWDTSNRARAAEAYRRALSLGEREFQVNARDARLLGYMAYYHAMLDEEEEARNSMKLALVTDPQDPELLFNLAQTCCRLGDTDRTLDWMKKAMAAGLSGKTVRNTPLFDGLQNNREFQNLLQDY